MMQIPSQQPSKEALLVLRVVTERAMDGYTVMSKTGLDSQQLTNAVSELIDLSVLNAKGDVLGPAIGEAYLWVPPDAQGYAEMLVASTRSQLKR